MILNLNQWALDTTGLDGWWAALQLDRAVSWFGRFVESALDEMRDGKPVHSLEELLGDETNGEGDLQAFLTAFGGALRRINT